MQVRLAVTLLLSSAHSYVGSPHAWPVGSIGVFFVCTANALFWKPSEVQVVSPASSQVAAVVTVEVASTVAVSTWDGSLRRRRQAHAG